VLRKLQTARVPDWASVYVGGLRAVGYRCVAMDYHGTSGVLLPLFSLLHMLGRVRFESDQSPFQSHHVVHRADSVLTTSKFKLCV